MLDKCEVCGKKTKKIKMKTDKEGSIHCYCENCYSW